MGIAVHEFMTLDGVIDAPVWTFETGPDWNNSEVIGAYAAERIRALKDEVDGDLYVSGSATLVHAMLRDGLIDELHLFVYPLTRGSGPRLFDDGEPASKWSLADSQRYDNGVLYLNYRLA